MVKVLVESPYAGDVTRNLQYLRAAMRDCFQRNEAPFSSHAFYIQALDDGVTYERDLGITAGLLWGKAAEKTVVYTDLGISSGMALGIESAIDAGRPVEYRTLPPGWA